MNNDRQRREFWIQQMESANGFLAKALDYPVEECGETLESLPDAAKAAGVKVEFSSSKLTGNYDRVFRLRKGLIPSFIIIAREMNGRGWVLKVEDGYRSRDMQKALFLKPAVFDQILEKVLWELNGEMPSPEFLFRRITALSATRPKIGTHMSGSAIDISVLRRDNRTEIDRGGPYLDMSERTPMISPFIPAEARQNREEITRLMEKHGFMAYPYEFWHYNKGDVYAEILTNSGRPGRYGAVDWNPSRHAVIPVPNPKDPLISDREIQFEIEQARQRILKKPASDQEGWR